MILNAYSIYDKKSGSFLPPFFCPSIPFAYRMLCQAYKREGDLHFDYSDDFELYELGSFDDESASFGLYAERKYVGSFTSILKTNNNNVD